MPRYKYQSHETGEIIELVVPSKEKDNLKDYTRIPSFPSEIRTEANSETLIDGQRLKDPNYRKALDIADRQVDLANAKNETERSMIRKEIKAKEKE